MATPDLWYFDDDGRTPNNAWPVIVHRVTLDAADPAAGLERLLADNDWPAQWRGGVFDYHHFHSNAHEVLAIASGSAELVLGGERGQTVTVTPGDVVILPAGTGHCRLTASEDFCLVAGYPPEQQDWDLCRTGQTDIDTARARIRATSRPACDPITGRRDGLLPHWLI